MDLIPKNIKYHTREIRWEQANANAVSLAVYFFPTLHFSSWNRNKQILNPVNK